MPVSATCTRCGTVYRLADSYAGRKIQCAHCQLIFVAPPLAEPILDALPVPDEPRPSERIQPARRPAAAEPPARRRRPLRKAGGPRAADVPLRKSNPVLIAVAAGGAAAVLLSLAVGVGLVLVFARQAPAPGTQGNEVAAAQDGPAPAADGGAREPEPAPPPVQVQVNPVPNAPAPDRGPPRLAEAEDRAPRPEPPVVQARPESAPKPDELRVGALPAVPAAPARPAPDPAPLPLDAGGGMIPAQTLDELKAATVFVKVTAGPLSASGSGFVLRTEGNLAYVVTNEHVINPESALGPPRRGGSRRTTARPRSGTVTLVFGSGTRREQALPAEVVTADAEKDLALLRVQGLNTTPRAIDWGHPPPLRETMPVYIFGFPFGQALALNQGNPAVTVGKGSVSSVRENNAGSVAGVQIDGAINPGNSGGPVVDAQGRLVGVAVAAIRGAGIGLAVPAAELERLLVGRVREFQTSQRVVGPQTAEVTVEAPVLDPLGRIREVFFLYRVNATLRSDDAGASAEWQPLPGAQRVQLSSTRPQARGTFRVTSKGAEVPVALQAGYVTDQGRTVHGQPLTIQVRLSAEAFASRPAGGGPADIRPAPLTGEKSVVPLPSPVGAVAVGGGGRYLILHLPGMRKLAVFDANEGRVSRYLPLAGDNVRIAAGADRLIVALPDNNALQRWSLRTFEREVTVTSPVTGTVKALCMGSAANGPLLVYSPDGEFRHGGVRFLDPATFRELDFGPEVNGFAGDHYRASADGRVFSTWSDGVSPQGINTLVLEGTVARRYRQHDSAGCLVPSPDGKVLYTRRGPYTIQCQPIGQPHNFGVAHTYVPAHHGTFYMDYSVIEGNHTLSVFLQGDTRPVMRLANFSLLTQGQLFDRSTLSPDLRLHLIPRAKLLVSIPGTNDQLVLHRFDLEQQLERSGVDYLLVLSQPPNTARKGTTLRYPMTIKSKQGGVQCKLESGPPGMTVTPQGVVTWAVPAGFAEAQTDVLISIRDRTGQEVFHTFQLTVDP